MNLNGEFTVTGWYNKGEVDDQSNKDVNVVVNSGVIIYHPIHIIPSCARTSPIDVQQSYVIDQDVINEFKFKVSAIQG